ncbi:YciI family protein [Aestuariispira insulae]|uniref:YCII-related domain-containing protein n=1 Tax=Aestuariispira insulae TaxID=1461337 RepID=A0A3D9HIJ7_9PROT|nr:YciI family protein [Aestuariispira insulae]RED49091.1 hypothetical protein DFP90_10668 [Aestuariispira insulae]
MAVVIECLDKDGALEIRKANREAHLAHLKSHMDKIIAAGPLLDDANETMVGSVLVMDFADKEAAQDFCDNDPYAKAGLFKSVSIKNWKKVLPAD